VRYNGDYLPWRIIKKMADAGIIKPEDRVELNPSDMFFL